MKTWLTLDQVVSLTAWSDRHVRRLADQGKVESRATETIARNGKPEREFALDSLPASAQVKHAKQFAIVPVDAVVASRKAVTPEQREKAEERLVPVLMLRRFIDGTRPTLELPDGRPVRNSNDYAELIAPQYGLTASGLWKRYQKYYVEKKDLSGARIDRGTSRFFAKYPEAAKQVLGLYAHNINITHIHDELKIWWPNNINHGSTPPSESTIREFLKNVPKVALDAVKMSKEKHDQKYAPYLRSDYSSALRVNQIWVSDHRIHDIFFQNDCFKSKPKLCWMRIWETAIQDMRSRTIVGSVFGVNPSSRTISSALRIAISRFGLPESFYIDNGKDYRKVGKGALHTNDEPEVLDEYGRVPMDPAAEGVLGRLGIKVQYCEPRHPQSKLIESYFSFQSKRLDRSFGTAYAGNRPDRRPDACGLALKQHKLFLENKVGVSPLPLASEGIQLALYWNEQFNSGHRHTGHGMDQRTPYEVFNELLPVDQRRLVNVAEIDELFWDRQKRTVRNLTVEAHTGMFEPSNDECAARLANVNGEEIYIACDPDDLSEAVALTLHGEYIGRLRSQQLVARGLNRSQEEIAEIQKSRRRFRKNLMGAWQAVRSGVDSPLDRLKDRAGLKHTVQPPPPPRASRALPEYAALAVGGSSPIYIDDAISELKKMEDDE